MKAIHPGRILRRELESREMSANALALALRTPSGRIVDILNGKRGISPETALRLARFFGARRKRSASVWREEVKPVAA
jgi:addiction module HigA family antidote